MKRYLFLAGWVEGSESASSPTGIHGPDDLLPRFQAGQEDMIAVLIQGAPNEDMAIAFGRAECWDENMTAHDSVSNMVEIPLNVSASVYEAQGVKVVNVSLHDTEFDHTGKPDCRCDECWR